MDIATFFGFIIGITGIVMAVIFNGGDFYDFLDAPSAMIVLGGTLALMSAAAGGHTAILQASLEVGAEVIKKTL